MLCGTTHVRSVPCGQTARLPSPLLLCHKCLLCVKLELVYIHVYMYMLCVRHIYTYVMIHVHRTALMSYSILELYNVMTRIRCRVVRPLGPS